MLRLMDGGIPKLLSFLLASLVATSGFPIDQSNDESSSPPANYSRWLDRVALLITEEERQGFSTLTRDYQRDAFVETFWEVRDPLPETRRNEFRETWNERHEMVAERYGQPDGDRAQTLLLAGPPQEILGDLCPQLLAPIEIWHYEPSREFEDDTYLVFAAPDGGEESTFRVWSPSEGRTGS